MAALFDATTGYPDDIADLADTTPQYGSASSGTNVGTYAMVLWTPEGLFPGILIDVSGGTGGGTTKESWGIIGV